MKVPVKRLTKRELEWLGTHLCEHSITYLEHYNCFLRESPSNCPIIKEKIAILDIETCHLKANFGYVLCIGVKPLGEEPIMHTIRPAEIRSGQFDRRLIEDFARHIHDFDRYIVYWGKPYRFDFPFLTARAIKHGVEWPDYGEIYVTDLYDYTKSRLPLHSRRLEVVCDFLGIESKGHKLNPEVWQRCMSGDKDAIEFVETHCREDLESTESVWNRLRNLRKIIKTSI